MYHRYRTPASPAALAGCTLVALLSAAPAAAQEEQRLSPLDSVTTTLDGADLAVQYGRPSMRGRAVFGGLVPFGEVWRTGANEATHFRTDTELRIGGTRIPAGEYTIYTIPGQEGWTLIVNRQTGQWGTQYDPERDLARIPMLVESLDNPVETFTVSIVSSPDAGGTDGELRLEWERTRASVPIRVAGTEAPGDSAGPGGDAGTDPGDGARDGAAETTDDA